ncbi:MAG: CocE/NonD family hydrolase [Pirellulales bacterium]|nr:CocE/NonD family hydrolase [Pirellulales bacterium]
MSLVKSRRPQWILLAAAVVLMGWAVSPAAGGPTESMVTMTDGTRLAVDVYLPENRAAKLPAIFVSTPYNKSGVKGFADGFLSRGYALVVADIRGRFKSEGNDAIIFHHHGWAKNHDGHDLLRWIAAQEWSNGRVGSYGGSAVGITQNMQAPGAPECLQAQYVEVAFSDMYSQCAYQGGCFRQCLLEGWLKATQMDPENLASFVAHPNKDAFWAELDPESQAARVNAPGVYVGGWYDIFVQGTINSFTSIQQQGEPGARGRCRLVLGPWAHGTFDELTYPPNSERRHVKAADHYRWFDALLKDTDNGVAQDRPVHYYVMGDPTDKEAPGNYWRAAADWPPPAEATAFFFHADGKLTRQPPTSAGTSRSYRYDPGNPVHTIGGQNLLIPKGPMDQRRIEEREDVLLFTSDLLAEPLEVTGRITARLFVSSDCPDTDFTVKLCDVYPDGRSMLVTDGILRARHRVSLASEDFLTPGEVYELAVDLWSTSLVFARGHRLRVAVSSSNSPRFEPNPNTGHAFRADKEQRVATNTLHLAADRASHIELPIYRGPEDREP